MCHALIRDMIMCYLFLFIGVVRHESFLFILILCYIFLFFVLHYFLSILIVVTALYGYDCCTFLFSFCHLIVLTVSDALHMTPR